MAKRRLGPYRLGERLGEGSTGVVYRANTGVASVAYAIKQIRPGLAQERPFVDSLLAEARICARLDHPGIVRLHEVGKARGEYFLAMEYVDGISLKQMLARLAQGPSATGRLAPAVACYLAAEVARALGYAHDRTDEQGHPLGIVHRDVNPSNIMVTRTAQVKLLDFGIALAASHLRGAGTGTLLGSGVVKGTLGYLSPEQAEGVPLDGRSDLFSLGAVLYECLTGQRLFDGRNALHSLQLLTQTEVTPPSRLCPEVPAALDAVVLRLLARKPGDRYASGEEAALALEGQARALSGQDQSPRDLLERLMASLPSLASDGAHETDGASIGYGHSATRVTRLLRQASTRRRLTRFAAAAALVGAIAAGGGVLLARRRAQTAATRVRAGNAARPMFIMAGFRNLTGRSIPGNEWLGPVLEEVIGTALGQGKRLRRIDSDHLAAVKRLLGPIDGDTLSAKARATIRGNLNADLAIVGSYTVSSQGQLQLDVHVEELAQGQTLASVEEIAGQADFVTIGLRAGRRLGAALGEEAPSPGDERAARAALPATAAATRLFAEGLAQLRLGQPAAARPLLDQAIAADAGHALSHLALARAWSMLDDDKRVHQEATAALQLTAPLSREQGLLVRAHAHDLTGRWQDAELAYRALCDLFPHDLDYGLGLAAAQGEQKKTTEARALLERLRALPGNQDEPRIDFTLAESVGGSPDETLRAALAGIDKARARGAELLVADGQAATLSSYRALRHCDEALGLAKAAKVTYERAGRWQDVIRVANFIGSCLNERRDDAGALRMAEEGLAISERIGDGQWTEQLLHNSALSLARLGRRSEAVPRFKRALVLARQAGDHEDAAGILRELAHDRADQADLAEAAAFARQAVDEVRSCCERKLPELLVDLATYQVHAGELGQARRASDEALALARRGSDLRLLLNALRNDASDLVLAGKLGEARRSLDEARVIATGLKWPDDQARTELGLGEVALAQGDAPGAEALARQILTVARTEPTISPATKRATHELLMRALLARGDSNAAGRALDEAGALPDALPFWIKVRFQAASARVEAARGHPRQARDSLQRLLRLCRDKGFVALELEVRLAALKVGPSSPALARSLASMARRRGFLAIANAAANPRRR